MDFVQIIIFIKNQRWVNYRAMVLHRKQILITPLPLALGHLCVDTVLDYLPVVVDTAVLCQKLLASHLPRHHQVVNLVFEK